MTVCLQKNFFNFNLHGGCSPGAPPSFQLCACFLHFTTLSYPKPRMSSYHNSKWL